MLMNSHIQNLVVEPLESYPAEQNPLGQRYYASVMILHLLVQLNVNFTQERGCAQHSHILAHVQQHIGL